MTESTESRYLIVPASLVRAAGRVAHIYRDTEGDSLEDLCREVAAFAAAPRDKGDPTAQPTVTTEAIRTALTPIFYGLGAARELATGTMADTDAVERIALAEQTARGLLEIVKVAEQAFRSKKETPRRAAEEISE